MIVDRNRKHLLGTILAYHVLIQNVIYFLRFGQLLCSGAALFLHLLADDIVA